MVSDSQIPSWINVICSVIAWGVPSSMVAYCLYLVVSTLHANRIYSPQMPEFWVDSAAVSALHVTRSELTGTWDFTLLPTNPNEKLDIKYYSLQATLFYGDGGRLMLATQTLPPPFILSKKNQTSVAFKLQTAGAYVGDDVAKEISQGMTRGLVRFRLQVMAWWRYKPEMEEFSYTDLLLVSCNPIEFGFNPNNATGTFTGQSIECQHDRTSEKTMD